MKTAETSSLDTRELTSIKWLKDEEFNGITIVEPTGWDDYEHFYKIKISKDEFITRLAKSEFKKTDEKKS